MIPWTPTPAYQSRGKVYSCCLWSATLKVRLTSVMSQAANNKSRLGNPWGHQSSESPQNPAELLRGLQGICSPGAQADLCDVAHNWQEILDGHPLGDELLLQGLQALPPPGHRHNPDASGGQHLAHRPPNAC